MSFYYFRQRLSFLRLLPHMLRFTNPSVLTFRGAHVRGGLWESGSGRVCQAPVTISAKAILAALACAASPQPRQGWYRERIWEQPQGNRSPARPQHVPLPPARLEGFGAQIPRGATEGAAGGKPRGSRGTLALNYPKEGYNLGICSRATQYRTGEHSLKMLHLNAGH